MFHIFANILEDLHDANLISSTQGETLNHIDVQKGKSAITCSLLQFAGTENVDNGLNEPFCPATKSDIQQPSKGQGTGFLDGFKFRPWPLGRIKLSQLIMADAVYE